MKRLISCILILLVMLACVPSAMAVDDSRSYFFELSVDGSNQKEVQTGDIITVTFYLRRTDTKDSCEMYGMQNEIRYDSDFFELVEGSALLSNGVTTTDIGLRDHYREFYMNYVSMTGGETWEADRLVGSFQLKVIGSSGVSKITNQDYLVSTRDGRDRYTATCQDVTIVISSDCNVRFETNGGSKLDGQTVRYGDLLQRPQTPVRAGYHLEGWYRDIDLKTPWDFDKDTVQGNMTLYAKWAQGDPVEEGGNSGRGGLWWLLGLLGLLLLLLLLFLLLGKKTVQFVTGDENGPENQKVKKGDRVTRPDEPVRPGRTFAGWYRDEACTQRWDFENDTVEENMKLYAKWL